MRKSIATSAEPDLRAKSCENARAVPGALFWILRNGDLRHGMPPFAHLPEAQRWQIIEFLQSGITR